MKKVVQTNLTSFDRIRITYTDITQATKHTKHLNKDKDNKEKTHGQGDKMNRFR